MRTWNMGVFAFRLWSRPMERLAAWMLGDGSPVALDAHQGSGSVALTRIKPRRARKRNIRVAGAFELASHTPRRNPHGCQDPGTPRMAGRIRRSGRRRTRHRARDAVACARPGA